MQVVVPMTASGGLLVAFTVKHTDTVIKSLATGSVIAVTTVVETCWVVTTTRSTIELKRIHF